MAYKEFKHEYGAMNGGRPPVYEPTLDGLALFKQNTNDYFTYNTNMNPGVCNIDEWCVYCGITRQTLGTYYKQRDDSWKAFIDFVKGNIAVMRKQSVRTNYIS